MESKEQTAVQVAESNSSQNNASWLNFNVIHIIVEVAALCGVAVYFSNKISVLNKHIENLNHRLEEQEETIQKHEEILKKLISIRQQQVASYRTPSPANSKDCVGGVCSLPNFSESKPVQHSQPRPQETIRNAPVLVVTTPLTEKIQPSSMPVITEVEETEPIDKGKVTEETLDAELEAELSELKEKGE